MLGLLKAAQLCCVLITSEASLESKLLYKAPTSPNSCQNIIIPPCPAWDHHSGQLVCPGQVDESVGSQLADALAGDSQPRLPLIGALGPSLRASFSA